MSRCWLIKYYTKSLKNLIEIKTGIFLFFIFQGMVINGFVNVVVSTIEKRFGLLSAETGLIAGSYDIGSMISVIPITYFGGRIGTSKPK